MSQSPAVVRLIQVADRFRSAVAARAAAMEELKEAIRAADREGVASRNEIAKLSGVARQTVFDALRGQRR